MKKRILAFLLCLLMLMPSSAFAADSSGGSQNNFSDAVNLLEEYGYEIIDASELTNNQDYIEFESLEELQNYLDSLEAFDESYTAEIPPINPLTRANGAETVSWYNPFAGFDGLTLLCWSNVDFTYNYKTVNGRPQYTSIEEITSYLTGISMTSWHQTSYSTSYSKKYSTKDTCTATVNGYYLLGVSIGGQPIGASRKSTWTATLTLVPA